MADERLDALLLRWEELVEQGRPASPEELCRDCPELLDELSRRVRALARMREALGVAKPGAPPASAPPKAPGIALRARIIRKGQAPTALIEVDGRIYTVTTGSMMVGSGNTTLKVVELNSTEVRLEVQPLKEFIVLR